MFEALGSLAGSILGIGAQKDINQQNISNSWSMWHATNEYNKPINQITRLREAGINPATAYGGLSNSAGLGSIAQAKVPDYSTVAQNFLNARQQAQNIENMKVQEQELKASVRKLNEDTKLSKANADFRREEVRRLKSLPEGSLRQDTPLNSLLRPTTDALIDISRGGFQKIKNFFKK